jgi:hypothetical protein
MAPAEMNRRHAWNMPLCFSTSGVTQIAAKVTIVAMTSMQEAEPVGPEGEAEAVGGEEGVFADELEAADLQVVGSQEVEAESRRLAPAPKSEMRRGAAPAMQNAAVTRGMRMSERSGLIMVSGR